MKHKWEKIDDPCNILIDQFFHYSKKYSVCKNCGLKKASVITLTFFPILIYFKHNKMISEGRIPYQCCEEIEFI